MADICCYIKTGGDRCAAFALHGKKFCFWHSKIHIFHDQINAPGMFPKYYHPDNDLKNRLKDSLADDYWSRQHPNGPTARELPALEDHTSIQLALSLLFNAIADNRIETKRASLMLYALQLASQNAGRVRTATEESVQDIVFDELGLPMAAPAPVPEPQPTEELAIA